MLTKTIEVTSTSAASVESVWALLADVETWCEWGSFDESMLERAGHPDPCGRGALRRFRKGPIKNLEEVVRFEPPHAFSYEVREGDIPMHGYHADVELQEVTGGGSVINWNSRFQARWPLAPLIAAGLRRFIAATADQLAIAAAREAPPQQVLESANPDR